MIRNKQCIIIISILISAVSATSVQMRVVRDTANYGYFGSNVNENENTEVPAVPPANFTGPSLLQRLIGRCYNLTQEQYRYKFCPFQNFSQYELSSRWNAYHGILGIWSHWEIKNNRFSSMIYKHGDQCGDTDRYVQVYIQCGTTEVLTNVSEPSRCHYIASFQSRYVCHNDSLLVYPRLKKNLQEKWDQFFTELKNGDITEKGYYYNLKKLFHSAGLLERSVSKGSDNATTISSSRLRNIFADLNMCNKEYKNIVKENVRLNQEIEALKLLLDLSKIENRTSKPH